MKSKTSLLLLLILFPIYGCHQLDSLSYDPPLTPELFLANQPWISISIGSFSFLLTQPSSTFFVYLLSLAYLYAAYIFWKVAPTHRSLLFWSLGFLFTGIAAILAGTSYQALGYELKCLSREFCRWTTWWEINYEILQNIGMNGFLAAAAFTHANSKFRKSILTYAGANSILYTILVLFGAFTPNSFLVSFEFLELSCLPSVIFFLITTFYGYFKTKNKMNLHLLTTWLFLVLIMLAYAIYLELGLTAIFWKKGIWFSENDVLHVGLILWVIYIVKTLPQRVVDKQ